MMRRFQRFDPDDRLHDIWVNDANVVCITSSGDAKALIEVVGGHVIKVRGWPGDIAKEFNGYFDE